jgi:hypothetical protein
LDIEDLLNTSNVKDDDHDDHDVEADETTKLLPSHSQSHSSGPRSARSRSEVSDTSHQGSSHFDARPASTVYSMHLNEVADHSSVVVRVRQHNLRTPLWTAIRSSEQSWLSYYMLGKHVPNKHEMLFWADKFGPTLNMFILRVHLFVQSIYFSLLVCYYIPAIFLEHSYYWGIVYTVVSLIPIFILIFGIYGQLLINMILAASTGILKEKSIVVEIVRAQKLEKVVRLLVMLTKLQSSARMSKAGGKGQKMRRRSFNESDPKIKAEIAEVSRIFDAHASNPGSYKLAH